METIPDRLVTVYFPNGEVVQLEKGGLYKGRFITSIYYTSDPAKIIVSGYDRVVLVTYVGFPFTTE